MEQGTTPPDSPFAQRRSSLLHSLCSSLMLPGSSSLSSPQWEKSLDRASSTSSSANNPYNNNNGKAMSNNNISIITNAIRRNPKAANFPDHSSGSNSSSTTGFNRWFVDDFNNNNNNNNNSSTVIMGNMRMIDEVTMGNKNTPDCSLQKEHPPLPVVGSRLSTQSKPELPLQGVGKNSDKSSEIELFGFDEDGDDTNGRVFLDSNSDTTFSLGSNFTISLTSLDATSEDGFDYDKFSHLILSGNPVSSSQNYDDLDDNIDMNDDLSQHSDLSSIPHVWGTEEMNYLFGGGYLDPDEYSEADDHVTRPQTAMTNLEDLLLENENELDLEGTEVGACSFCMESLHLSDLEGVFQCPHCQSLSCAACLSGYIRVAIQERKPIITCFGSECSNLLSIPSLAPFVSDELTEEYERMATLALNSKLRECPRCYAIIQGSRTQPNLTCSQCSLQFCFHHELAHEGLECQIRVPLRMRVRNWCWKAMHTKKCPACSSRIEKNGGCSHMTCKCGYEVCWHCMGPYTKHGRRGHSRSLFPPPSELRFTCNDWKMWASRCGVSLLIPVAVPLVFASVLCVGGVVAGTRVVASVRNKLKSTQNSRIVGVDE